MGVGTTDTPFDLYDSLANDSMVWAGVECCSALTINENLVIHFNRPMPNAWWRFWQFVLLGWKWEV